MGDVANQRQASEPTTPPHASAKSQVAIARSPFLAADVGGTHARIALVAHAPGHVRPVQVLHYHRYRCAQWPSLTAMLLDFAHSDAARAASGSARIEHCAMACAGYLLDGMIVNENLPWPVPVGEIRERLGLGRLEVINDFEALAYAVQYVDPADTLPVIDAASPASGPVLVMGPGTGLGSALLLPGTTPATVLPSEAGMVSLAPGDEREIEILRLFRRERRHVAYEDALSGPGLLRLYRALGELRGRQASLSTPADVTAAALSGSDDAAVEALQVFCGLLGSFVGDLVLLYRARCVYLAGGILPQVHAFLQASTFAARYFDKGVMRPYLEQVPVRLVEHGQLGVIGAAGWLLDEQPRGTR